MEAYKCFNIAKYIGKMSQYKRQKLIRALEILSSEEGAEPDHHWAYPPEREEFRISIEDDKVVSVITTDQPGVQPGPSPDFISFVPTPLRLDMARGDMVRDIGAGRKSVLTHISGGIRAKVGRGDVDVSVVTVDQPGVQPGPAPDFISFVPRPLRLNMARGDMVQDIEAGRKSVLNHIYGGIGAYAHLLTQPQ